MWEVSGRGEERESPAARVALPAPSIEDPLPARSMMAPTTVRRLAPRQTLAERAYAHLRDAIVRGRIRPGEVISTGRIAKAMGISSMPVRVALTRLETEGLLMILP